MEKTLPKIIHFNQNAFVKGTTIFVAIRTIEDVVEYTKQKGLSGILLAVDFEKSFDTLNFNYLIRILHEFNFGPSFIQWIRVLYENVSSCVLNNGSSTGPFSVGRGVKFGEENVKLNLLADDMSCFLSDKGSYISLFRLLEDFGECSGLKVNHEKTEALVFGDSSLW